MFRTIKQISILSALLISLSGCFPWIIIPDEVDGIYVGKRTDKEGKTIESILRQEITPRGKYLASPEGSRSFSRGETKYKYFVVKEGGSKTKLPFFDNEGYTWYLWQWSFIPINNTDKWLAARFLPDKNNGETNSAPEKTDSEIARSFHLIVFNPKATVSEKVFDILLPENVTDIWDALKVDQNKNEISFKNKEGRMIYNFSDNEVIKN